MAALVLGATGFIGSSVASALLKNGWSVIGTARGAEAAEKLDQMGVIPLLIQRVQDGGEWVEFVAERCTLVVECLSDKTDKGTMKAVHELLVGLLRQKPSLNVIFTSGCFSYGYDPKDKLRVFSELDDYSLSCKASMGRHPIEAAYREAGAIVIVPAMVYGNGGGPILHHYGQVIRTAKIKGTEAVLYSCYGDGSQYLSSVHCSDLGELYALVAAQATFLRGQVFNVSSNMERFDSIADSLAIAFAFDNPVKYLVPEETNLKEQAYGCNVRLDAQKAKNFLGWRPVQPSFLASVRSEVALFEASQSHQ